jgi:hypothetical protein
MRAFNCIFFILLSLHSPDIFASAKTVFKNNQGAVVKVISLDKAGNIISQGSGVAAGKNIIITNRHVIDGAYEVYVLSEGERSKARDIMVSDNLDVALFAVDKDFPKVSFSKEIPEIGSVIYALGNPLGLEKTISEGIVSGVRGDLIQITAAISLGSSGGALFNENGDVIGITTLKAAKGENINFAISFGSLSNTQLKKYQPSEISKPTPLIDNSYLIGVRDDGNTRGITLIKEGDFLIDGNNLYASIATRIYTEDPENGQTFWLEHVDRVAYNCAAGTFAILNMKALSIDSQIVISNVEEVPEWELPNEENVGKYHRLICSLRKMPSDRVKQFLSMGHDGLINDVHFRVLRVEDLYSPIYSTTELTPLGYYLWENVEGYENLHLFLQSMADSF